MVISTASKHKTLSFFLILISSHLASAHSTRNATITTTCTAVHHRNSSHSKCLYVKTTAGCHPQSYINYIQIFYCNFSRFPQLGFVLLLLWLFILFYILSNTASDYFCPAVENLSKILNLSPAIAGTTLLPLGNGCTDVFASIISFTASGDGGDIGLNSILGGSIFISTIVVGILTILITSRGKIVIIDKPNFIRDVVFLLLSLSNLLVIILFGRISFWASVIFASTYIIYICLVSYMHLVSIKKQKITLVVEDDHDQESGVRIPLLGCVDDEQKVAHYAEKVVPHRKNRGIMSFLFVLGLPLYLPRRITIPVVTKERWSKPFAVISMVLAPLMLILIWGEMGSKASLAAYLVGGAIGIALGTCTFALTSSTIAPQKCMFFWHASGFIMSVTWTYIIADELVSLLESLGTIIGMSPSILGLTILAWGNSIGDLTANIAIALYGGPDGAQIAISGCYAGPVFNVLVGLGFSLVLASWSDYPAPYRIPIDPYLCETIGFLMGALLWALVILPKRNMQLDRILGGGLLAIYSCFVFIKLARALGLLNESSSNLVKSF